MNRDFRYLTLVFLAGLFAANTTALELQSYNKHHYPEGEFKVSPPAESSPNGNSIMKVIGSKDFEKIRDTQKQDEIRHLSQRVAWILMENGVCTGSLVGPDLLLTNEHCAFDNGKQVPLNEIVFTFHYYYDDLALAKKNPVYKAVKLLKYNKDLDYALYQLNARPGDQLGWFNVDSSNSNLRTSDQVRIIQHPAGRSKEVSRKNAGVKSIFLRQGLLHYFADTEGGSSGSPVLKADGDSIIALHHVGSARFNEGILSSHIYPEIQQFLPQPARSKRSGADQPKATPTPPIAPPSQTRRSPASPNPPPTTKTQSPRPASPPPPATPAPKRQDCNGLGVAVESANGEIECMRW